MKYKYTEAMAVRKINWIAVRHDIIMKALKLAKSHTNWKSGRGSIHSFSKAKTEFVDTVDAIMEVVK